MKLTDLAPETLERVRSCRWDRIIEKHEGPEVWGETLNYTDVEFLKLEGIWILLPVGREQHPNITVLRCLVSEDRSAVTLFLKDTTWADEGYERFTAGFLAVCDRFPGEDFYVAVAYHEWFIVENPALLP